MQKLIIMILSSILIGGCATSQRAPRRENLFTINGQTIEISDELLETYRSRWVGSSLIEAGPDLRKEDLQWSLDLISMYESLQNEDCKQFQLMQTRDFNSEIDTDKRYPNLLPGKFDYVWEIDVCGKYRHYRVVNSMGSGDFSVHLIAP
ncbi:MAG: hypothetical protein WBN43_11475 [Thiogranum sp.]